MKNETKNWIDSAQYDLETAEHLFTTGRYIYTIFMCHLALEKMLKAKIEEITGKIPPKTHDLEYLLGLSGLSPNPEQEKFIAEISNLSIVTRYPGDFHQMIKDFSKTRTELILVKSKEIIEWINKSLIP